jgi:phospholipid/cholesterol/gamma-HCH transport system ATP-binding protein
VGSMSELAQMDHPLIRQYFDGPRGRAAQQQQANGKTWNQK